VYRLARRRNILIQRVLYGLSRARPGFVRGVIRKSAERHLRGAADLAHFDPSYDPWDQRLCIVPDGDLFRVIREGRAEIVTDRIETFTRTGIRLASGAELDADIVVSATGLQVQMLGGAALEVDGEPVAVNRSVTYKGVLLEGVPNLSAIFGYTNASWTLKADIACEYTCRLLNYLDAHGYTQVVARATDADRSDDSVLGSLTSGYVRRGNDRLPRQGTHGPWKVRNDYLRDAPMLKRSPIADGILQFARRPARPRGGDETPEPVAAAN
jgi:cation diffusion facilitator CzcD-associated flavoprotein CzcO